MPKTKKAVLDTRIKNPEKYEYPFNEWEKMTGEEFHRYKRNAVSFYSTHTPAANLVSYTKKWMKENGYRKPQIDLVAGSSFLTVVVSVLCKLRTTGCPSFNEKENDHWESLAGTTGKVIPLDNSIRERIDRIIEETPKQKKTENNKLTISVRDRMLMQLDPIISDIEGMLDDWLDGKLKKKDIDVYRFLISSETPIKPAHAKIILEHFQRMIDELKEVVENKDPDLKEGYSHLTITKRKELYSIYASIEEACNMLIQKGKTQRKPRKPKEKSKEKLVEKVKYKEVDAEYGIASVHPSNIIGASEVWVFNTKYRKLGKYVADEYEKTLTVKGTTIQGFDKGLSIQKTLRKPKDQLKEFSTAGKVALRKFMDGVSAKESALTGRINSDTVILKAT